MWQKGNSFAEVDRGPTRQPNKNSKSVLKEIRNKSRLSEFFSKNKVN
jgi:hypothetical protein